MRAAQFKAGAHALLRAAAVRESGGSSGPVIQAQLARAPGVVSQEGPFPLQKKVAGWLAARGAQNMCGPRRHLRPHRSQQQAPIVRMTRCFLPLRLPPPALSWRPVEEQALHSAPSSSARHPCPPSRVHFAPPFTVQTSAAGAFSAAACCTWPLSPHIGGCGSTVLSLRCIPTEQSLLLAAEWTPPASL